MVSRQSAAEGLLVLGIGHPRGSRCPLGAMHESWVLLGGVGALHEVRGFVQYAQLLASSPRGSWSSRPGHGRLRLWGGDGQGAEGLESDEARGISGAHTQAVPIGVCCHKGVAELEDGRLQKHRNAQRLPLCV